MGSCCCTPCCCVPCPFGIIGLTPEQAKAFGYKIRVVQSDAANHNGTLHTRDYCPSRLNVIVYKGKIVGVSSLG